MNRSVFAPALCIAASILGLGTFSRDALAYGEAQCADVNIENTLFSQMGSISVAGGYSNPDCYKAYLIDVDDLTLIDGQSISIAWNDTGGATQAACESLWLSVEEYMWDSSAWIEISETNSNGLWLTFGGVGGCHPPSISLRPSNGANYRFSITARTSQTSGAPTKAFTFGPFTPAQ